MTIAAMVSAGSAIFYRPKDKAIYADNAHKNFHMGNPGDHIAQLNVFNGWVETAYSAQWCFENFVQVRDVLTGRHRRLLGSARPSLSEGVACQEYRPFVNGWHKGIVVHLAPNACKLRCLLSARLEVVRSSALSLC